MLTTSGFPATASHRSGCSGLSVHPRLVARRGVLVRAAAASVASPPFLTQKGAVDHVQWVLHEIDKGDKVVIAQTAPAVRVALGEEFGLEPGTPTTGQMVSALKKLGFDYVFDTQAGADLTIMEEAEELVQRLYSRVHPEEGHPAPLPMFTSCCPAWVETVERRHPDMIPHLSSAKSPIAIGAAAVKQYFAQKIGRTPREIVMVPVTPCLKKQAEADRMMMHTMDGAREVDHNWTTKDLAALIKERGWDYVNLPVEEFDAFLGIATGAGAIFGSTGGVMEAVLRTAYYFASGEHLPRLHLTEVRGLEGIKEATVTVPANPLGRLRNAEPVEVRVAVANGLGNAKKVLDGIKKGSSEYDFVEVMACPGGCIGGGGQPRSKDKEVLHKRQQGIYSVEERLAIRRSYESPVMQALYNEWLGQPGSHEAHTHLHTYFEVCGPASFDITAPPPPLERQAPACELPNLVGKVCLVGPESEADYLGEASDAEGAGVQHGAGSQ
ncbi:hypothetical protein N2152v2_001162 [Parachlorella kessleri]